MRQVSSPVRWGAGEKADRTSLAAYPASTYSSYFSCVSFSAFLPSKRHMTHKFRHLGFANSILNRGHEHQRLIRRCNAREGRPRCFGGTQRGSGTWNENDNSSWIVQQWSVIPAAMSGVVCCV